VTQWYTGDVIDWYQSFVRLFYGVAWPAWVARDVTTSNLGKGGL
jgi:hypothetical protein